METKYVRCPNIKEVERVIKMSGLTTLRFEKFYGLPKETIAKFRNKKRKLHPRFWHLFFDPPKPIRDKIDAIDAFRHKKNKHNNFVSRFEKAGKVVKKNGSRVKKIGVLAQLLS